jgi:NAD(P)-dependent dehydrogenase (short-subunit alcohol dehydrogenase family)
VYGASGGLATALAQRLLDDGWQLDLITRPDRRALVEATFAAALASHRARIFTTPGRYCDHAVDEPYDAIYFTQALFAPGPLAETEAARIDAEIDVGLTDLIRGTSAILARHPPQPGQRRDFCYIGSTSAYAGFRNTALYCAVKHGLLGFVRAMNEEYADTDTRFWLFSMGTMNTEMGKKITGQDPTSYLDPEDVAARIASTITNRSNVFEPEVIMRRRTIRLSGR